MENIILQNSKLGGFIYIRDHESYKQYNAYKLGITYNIIEREYTYLTGEIPYSKIKS